MRRFYAPRIARCTTVDDTSAPSHHSSLTRSGRSISVPEAWAIFLLLATPGSPPPTSGTASRNAPQRSKQPRKKLHDDLSVELGHVAIVDHEAADRAAAMLERAPA
jgi:hypothetical protein